MLVDQDYAESTVKPCTSYFICTTPRSGTVLLCDALADTGVAGYPAEYFNPPEEPRWAARWSLLEYSYAEYLEAVLERATTPNGVCGIKMMRSLFDRFACQVQQIPQYAGLDLPHMLHAVFPNLHYIWLTRQDKIAQAVSHWKGIQTGIWHVTAGESLVPANVPKYDFAAIDHLVREGESRDSAWHRYFADNAIEPFTVVYEEFVDAYEATVYELLAFLGVRYGGLSVAQPRLTKQADAVSEEWTWRYRRTVRP